MIAIDEGDRITLESFTSNLVPGRRGTKGEFKIYTTGDPLRSFHAFWESRQEEGRAVLGKGPITITLVAFGSPEGQAPK